MKKNKDILKIILVTLISIFLMMGAAAVLLANHRREVAQEKRKQQAMEILDSVPKLTPVAATATPTPEPTVTPTPTPVITILPAFNPEEYWGYWYSPDGLTCVNIYELSLNSISFSYSKESDGSPIHVSEGDVKAEVAGNAAVLSFTDSFGSEVSGNLIFDNGKLYVRMTAVLAEGTPIDPSMDCILTREKKEPLPTVQAAPTQNAEPAADPGDYYFPESNSRYLTDEEVSRYSSSELELAKNEIYARHGRRFVTRRIADYFNGKSWYQGTVDPQEFDASQDSFFNEYEVANIQKILQWEQKKRSEGN